MSVDNKVPSVSNNDKNIIISTRMLHIISIHKGIIDKIYKNKIIPSCEVKDYYTNNRIDKHKISSLLGNKLNIILNNNKGKLLQLMKNRLSDIKDKNSVYQEFTNIVYDNVKTNWETNPNNIIQNPFKIVTEMLESIIKEIDNYDVTEKIKNSFSPNEATIIKQEIENYKKHLIEKITNDKDKELCNKENNDSNFTKQILIVLRDNIQQFVYSLDLNKGGKKATKKQRKTHKSRKTRKNRKSRKNRH
jgi:hypothetical protein